MIASLKGVLQHKGLDRVVVDVGGVGYLAHVSSQTLGALPGEGEPVRLLCHTHVREDALQIYGFADAAEQTAFELLISVSGIGPKLALTTLSGLPVRELLGAIAAGDHRRLQTIPGVGRKTAERMVVELKERCGRLAGELAADGARPPTALGTGEVIEALVNLGYKRAHAEGAVERVLRESEGVPRPEALLRAALAKIREV